MALFTVCPGESAPLLVVKMPVGLYVAETECGDPLAVSDDVEVEAHAVAATTGEHAPKLIGDPGVPSMVNTTLPVGAVAPVLAWIAALKVTLSPKIEGFSDDVTVVVVAVAVLKVTVNPPLPPNTSWHGLVVPAQVEEVVLEGRLQPAKVEPELAVAVNEITAPLADVVMLFDVQLLVIVWEAAADP